MANSQEIVQINEIEAGLNKLNTTMNTTSTNYLKLVKTIADNTVVLKEQAITFDNVSKAQKQTVDNSKQLDALGKQLAATEQKLKDLEDSRTKTLIENRIKINESTQATKDKIKAEQAAEGSLIRMRQRLKELTTEYDKSGTRTKAAASEINKLSREIGKAEAATNRHQRGVGGYADQLGVLGDKMSMLPGIAGRASSSVTGLATKLATLGPIGGIIAGSILAISAPLVAFFTKSERGVEMLERKTAGFKAAWGVLVGEMISGGEKIADALDKPEKKTQTFWTKIAMGINPAFVQLGMKMDMASVSAENYTRKIQEMEDAERGLIVPRSQANFKIKEAMLLYSDESKSLDVRMNALKAAIELENKTADSEIEHAKQVVENIKEINREKQFAGQLRDEDDKKLQESIARVTDLETESLGRQMRAARRLETGRKEILEGKKKTEKEDDKLAKAEIDRNYDIAQSLAAIEEKRQEATKKASAKIAEQWEKDQEIAEQRAEEILQYEIDLNAAIVDENTKRNEQIKKDDEEAAKERKELQIQLASEAMNAIFELNAMKFEKELNDLQIEKDNKLSNEKLTQEQRAAITEEYRKKENAIKTKQAKNEKIQALFNVVLNTAVAVMKAAPNIALMALTGAIGAIQSGLIMSQPIPKYAKGGISKEGRGIFGEAGRELMFLPSGEIAMANQATYFEGSKFKGAKIVSNPVTEQMIKESRRSGMSGNNMSDERIIKGLNSVERAIMSKPVMIFDKENRAIGHATSNSQTIYLNRLMRNN